MAQKNVLLAVEGLENTYKFTKICKHLDVHVETTRNLGRDIPLGYQGKYDLLVYEITSDATERLARINCSTLGDNGTALLLVIDEEDLPDLRLPAQVTSDFVTSRASAAECEIRMRHLLWSSADGDSSDLVRVGGMIINLATYQVTINGDPLDLTYLEYALLSFLATHPGRTFSRQALLHRVWGLDYYGGSRTVDVHVRRIRAKLGPDLSLHLKTVRGVGYLWQEHTRTPEDTEEIEGR